MHVVVVGCGRVGSELVEPRSRSRATRSPIIDKNPHGVPAAARRLRRPAPSSGSASTATTSTEAGIEGAERARRRHQRRQLQHPHGPHRPGELRDRARRGPDLRPPPRGDLPAPRHPDRRHRRRGPPTRCCAACSPSDEQPHDWIDPSGKVCLVEHTLPDRVGRRRSSPASTSRGRFWLTAVSRAGDGPDRRPRPSSGQEGDVLLVRRASVETPRRTARTASTKDRSTDARRHRRSRQRRHVHRQRPLRAPATRCCSSSSSPRSVTGPRSPTASSGSSPTPARSPRSATPASTAATSWSRPPATTRTTSWSRCSPSRSSRVPRVIARVNHPKNEWLFNETWGVDLSVSTPHLLTALVEEAVSVGPPRAAPAVRGWRRPPRRGHPRRRLAGRSTRRSPSSTCRATPRSWPWSATSTW